ncbi:hypothetical protein ACWC5I_19850 [Kitasatospora sp. NPDC001574]
MNGPSVFWAASGLTEEDWEILTAAVEAFDGQPKVLCRQVAEALKGQDGQRWPNATAATVGDVFRRAGVFRKSVRVGEEFSTGAHLDDLHTLIAQHPA